MSRSCDAGFNICFTASKCNDARTSTSACWIYILCKCCFTFFLVFRLYKKERKIYNGEGNDKAAVSSDMDRVKAASKSFLSKSIVERSVHASNITKLEASPLSKTFRSEENFKKSNRDETILFPSKYPPEYIPVGITSYTEFIRTITFIMKYDLLTIVAVNKCFVHSMFTGICSSLIAMLHKYERHLKEDCEFLDHEQDSAIQLKSFIMGMKSPFTFAVTSYKFLPIFLLLAYIAFLVDRWRNFMVVCHTIQGRLHDLGAIIGSIPGKNVSDEEKAQLYKLYRLMNTLHIILYQNFLREEFKHGALFSTLVDLDLLTQNEADAYVARGSKLRDSLTSNLMTEISELIQISNKRQDLPINSQLLESKSVVAHQKVCDLRGLMSKFVDLSIRDNPNEYILAMRVVVELLKVMITFGYPVLMFAESSADYNCFQPLAIFGTLFILLSLTMPFILFERLASPFDAADDIRLEHLCASTELTLFQCLRSQYCDDLTPKATRSNFKSHHGYESSDESSCTFLPSVKDEQIGNSYIASIKKSNRKSGPPKSRLEKFLESINDFDYRHDEQNKTQLDMLKYNKGNDHGALSVISELTSDEKKDTTTSHVRFEKVVTKNDAEDPLKAKVTSRDENDTTNKVEELKSKKREKEHRLLTDLYSQGTFRK